MGSRRGGKTFCLQLCPAPKAEHIVGLFIDAAWDRLKTNLLEKTTFPILTDRKNGAD